MGAEERAGQYPPAVQVVGALELDGQNTPSVQLAGAVEPEGQYVLAGHAVRSKGDTQYEPPGQLACEGDPAGQ